MIITIICVVLIAAGIIGDITLDYHRELWDVSLAASVLGTFGLIICLILIALTHAPRIVEKDHQKMLNQKYVLEERLKNVDDSLVVQDWLYDDILEFNNNIYSTKKNLENPWINWFANYKSIEGIDYIEYGNINWSGE